MTRTKRKPSKPQTKKKAGRVKNGPTASDAKADAPLGRTRVLSSPVGQPPDDITPAFFIRELMRTGLAQDKNFYRLARGYYHIKTDAVGCVQATAQGGVMRVVAYAADCPPSRAA